uniref:RxLR effector protein n=1 Tax=Phytophthora ramorum TaxID=164328 RepID=H3GPV0_PHYRM
MRFGFFLILVITTFVVGCLNLASAKEAVKIVAIEDLWKNALPKVKAIGSLRVAGKARAAKNRWKGLADKMKAGQLKNLDTTDPNWQKAIVKVEAAGQLSKVGKTKIVKTTENVAHEVANNPSKWRYVYKALLVTFGVTVTALIVVGLQAMMSSK